MTSILESPVRWRVEGRAPALKERASPSEAFRKPVITDPTYIKRCRQPPATSRRGLCLPSPFLPFSLLHRLPRLLSAFYLYRPVPGFLSTVSVPPAVSISLERARAFAHVCSFTLPSFSFLFCLSFVLSVHFEQASRFDSDSGPPYLTLPPSRPSSTIRVQRALRFLFYFTLLLYLLTHSRFLSTSPFLTPVLPFNLPPPLSFSSSQFRLLCRQSQFATNCPKNRTGDGSIRGRTEEWHLSAFLPSLCFTSLSLVPVTWIREIFPADI